LGSWLRLHCIFFWLFSRRSWGWGWAARTDNFIDFVESLIDLFLNNKMITPTI
jgi:hypothetical protein